MNDYFYLFNLYYELIDIVIFGTDYLRPEHYSFIKFVNIKK